MRAVVQRVRSAEVRVDDQVIGRVGRGLLVLIGIGAGDTRDSAQALAEKIVHLRIFDDDARRMNRSLLDAGGSVLCVSQFTLYGDCRKGRRPSYDRAAPPEVARPLYEAFVDSLRALLAGTCSQVETGQFQTMMEVDSVNEGPVTLLLDSDRTF
jgi:D-aminoacyl-tRNA deacylase